MNNLPWLTIATTIISLSAAPLASNASPTYGPPTLTPIAARDVSDACPGTKHFAQALISGITRDDAHIARPLFASCAAQWRLPEYLWKTDAANLALGAVDLSLGVLDNDQAALLRAVDETADLRSRSLATDEQIHSWNVIPDYTLPYTHEAATIAYLPLPPYNAQTQRPPFSKGFEAENAAYIYIAAQTATPWIHTPRVIEGISRLGISNPDDFPTKMDHKLP
jgi:hypothetical protein